MKPAFLFQRPQHLHLAWLAVVLTAVALPIAGMMFAASRGSVAQAPIVGAILSVSLMGAGMIGAAASGRLWVGVLVALVTGAGALFVGHGLEVWPVGYPLSLMLVIVIASVSFAVRGALFARSAGDKGWWIALGVVSGEAAMLATASALPGALPDGLLVLLPAQWANVALQNAFTGAGACAGSAVLLALGGTAAATWIVIRLWPRRWPYLIMFTAWLGLSALVWHESTDAGVPDVSAQSGMAARLAGAP